MSPAAVIPTIVVVCALAAVGLAIFRRPQTGLLALAALTPFNGLTAIIGPGVVPPWWKEALLAVTLVAAVLSPRVRRPSTFTIPWWPAFAAFAVFGCASAIIVHGQQSLMPIKIGFVYVAIVFVLWLAPFTYRDRDRLVTIVIAVAAINAVVGIAQQFVGVDNLVALGYTYGQQVRTAGPFLRSFGTFAMPFNYGLFITIAILIGLAVALGDPRRTRNRVFFCLLPLLLAGMAVSLVRASYVGLLMGVLWIGFVRYRKLLAGLLVAAVVAVPTFLLLVPATVTQTTLSSDSFAVRAAGWQQAWDLLLAHPLGQGFGVAAVSASTIDAGAIDFPDSLKSRIDGSPGYTMGLPYQPDDYYIKILIEMGPVGLWLFVMFLVCAVATAAAVARRAVREADSGLALGVSAVMVSAAAASVVSTYFEIFPMDVYTWLLLGTVACIPLRSRATKSPTSPQSQSELVAAGAGR